MIVGVTGDLGFIGKHLCKALREKGHEVIGMDVKRTHEEDITHNYFQKIRNCDAIIHLAAMLLQESYENPEGACLTNCAGTAAVLDFCAHKKIKFVMASTWAADSTEAPYDFTKKCAENLVKFYDKHKGVPGIILRLATVYGEGMNPNGVIPTFLKQSKASVPLTVHGRGDQSRQFLHVLDAVNAIITVLEKGKRGETYTACSDELVTMWDLADMIGEKIVHVTSKDGDPAYKPLDNSKLKNLNWPMPLVPLKEGIKWLKKNP